MNNTIVVIVVVLLVLGGGYYLLTKGSGAAPTETPTTTSEATVPATSNETTSTTTTTTTTTTTAVSPTVSLVSIQNYSFNPSPLTVKTGTKVTWTNNDSVPHTVTSDSAGVFNSAPIPPGQSFSYTFTAPGTVSYHCAIHPMMKGSVTVSK